MSQMCVWTRKVAAISSCLYAQFSIDICSILCDNLIRKSEGKEHMDIFKIIIWLLSRLDGHYLVG